MKYLKWSERILQIICCTLLMFCITFRFKELYIVEIIIITTTTLVTTIRNYQTVKKINRNTEELSLLPLLEHKHFTSSEAWMQYKHEHYAHKAFYEGEKAKNNLLKKHNCHIENQYRWFETLFLCMALVLQFLNLTKDIT